MKKLAITLFFFASVACTAFAQEAQAPATQEASAKKIEMSAVPANVQDAFKNGGYKAEDATEINEITEANGKVYSFTVKDGDSKWVVRFDATGKLLDKTEAKNEE